MRSVLEFLDRAADRSPDKTVFSDQEKAVTYAQLRGLSRRIGSALGEKLRQVNSPVAVLIDRNVESLCAFMGIVASRNFYVPIDVSQPVQRVRTILEQMQPVALISVGNLSEQLRPYVQTPVFEYGQLAAWEEDPAALETLRASAMDTDPLYAICTSGSTGVPKGVLISHRSVLDFIPVFAKTFSFDENEIFANQAPFDFDVSVKDIYSTLYCGASMFVVPQTCFSMPKLLMDQLEDRKVTTIIWAVSALCIVAGINAFKHRVPSHLKKIMFSGETMPVKMLNIWRKNIPDAMYVNLYGPTEITCNCMYYVIDREFDNADRLPLGVAFENEGVYVLGEDDKPVKTGQIGEICVTGTCLALGYYRNPERTAAAFVQNPLNDRYPELMYRTGDMAQLAEDGEYYFAARKDFQIKHMGHRIELEEIEIHIGAVEGVTRASCLFDEDRNKIVAYYAGTADKLAVIDALKEHLPKYMIPNIFVQVDALPINKNGKVDRQRIKAMYYGKE